MDRTPVLDTYRLTDGDAPTCARVKSERVPRINDMDVLPSGDHLVAVTEEHNIEVRRSRDCDLLWTSLLQAMSGVRWQLAASILPSGVHLVAVVVERQQNLRNYHVLCQMTRPESTSSVSWGDLKPRWRRSPAQN
jgi:hypothetical protein